MLPTVAGKKARDAVYAGTVKTSNTFRDILYETGQAHDMRRPLYEQIEAQIEDHLNVKARVLAFFTSFSFPVIIEDSDADMIEEVLRNTEMDGRQLFLILNSPGGSGLAAERIVNICRTYGKGSFSVVVPKMAKSAATMVCFGAKTILMSPTSELGPVDPQVPIRDENGRVVSYQAAHEVLEAYNELLKQANTTKGRVEPYLQQLARIDAREIRAIMSAQKLADHITLTSLKSGCLKGKTEKVIRTRVKSFLDPHHTISHGRPIYREVAKACGLDITEVDIDSPLWHSVWSLYVRLNHLTQTNASKVVESVATEYLTGVSRG
jgi:serine dehydrogenase proteinase